MARAFQCPVAISNVTARKDSKVKHARKMWKNVTRCHANTVEPVEIHLDLISKYNTPFLNSISKIKHTKDLCKMSIKYTHTIYIISWIILINNWDYKKWKGSVTVLIGSAKCQSESAFNCIVSVKLYENLLLFPTIVINTAAEWRI